MEEIKTTSSQKFPLENSDEGEQTLVNCRNCGRHFAANRVQTHEWICQKQKKRKPFDISQQRIRGTEAEKFYKKNKNRNKSGKPTSPSPQKNWRKQHEEFIMSMRAAREVTSFLKRGGNLRDLPPPPPSDYSDYIQCPTCQRKFNQAAAERHIPKCAEMQFNKPKPPPPKPAGKSPKTKETTARTKK